MQLCLNTATVMPYSLEETVVAAGRAGIHNIGLWVEPVMEAGTTKTRQLLDDNGLTATSMSRVGFLANKTGQELRDAQDHCRRALEMCAELSIPTLAFVAGGLPPENRSVRQAEARVRETLDVLERDIIASGTRVLLEPIHPLFVNDRSMVTTTGQALRMLEGLDAKYFGVLLDSWATFWDPELEDSIARAGAENRIGGWQINDFALPLPYPNNMNSRLMPGDGTIDLVSITRWILDAGYTGPIEVEVFNDEIWAQPIDTILEQTVASYDRVVASNFA